MSGSGRFRWVALRSGRWTRHTGNMNTAHLDVERLADSLRDRYSDSVTLDQVQAAIAQARGEIEPRSRHPEFMSILIERRARDLLAADAKAHGEKLHVVPTVLFVSEHNSSRSQMAAAWAKHFGGPHVHVRAAGEHSVGFVNPLVERAMAEAGVRIDQVFEAGEVRELAQAHDVIVEMGAHLNNVPGRTYRHWPVPDPHGEPMDTVRSVRDDLKARVLDLLTDLDVPLTQ